ncbi:MAG: SurA N-terminal domain-containing protein [Roseibium sp.]
MIRPLWQGFARISARFDAAGIEIETGDVMLDALRKGAGTWIAKLFIGLLIFSFAAWGVTDFLQGFGQNTAAKVGESEVSLYEFDRTYRQELNRIGQQIGRPLSPQEGAQLGLVQQALGQLVGEAAMNNASRELQLGVSDARLSSIIQSDPSFQGATGRYDRGRLQQLLQANGYREDEYVIQRRRIAERSQLSEGIAGGMVAPASYLEALNSYQRETRSIDYLLVTAEQIGEIADPADDVLASYYEDNKANFRAPEYREIKFVTLTPESLARPSDVTDEDARAEYERAKDDFFEPERRKVRQMSFSSKEDAEAAANELAGGKTFDELMADRNLVSNDVTLGVMAQADFLDEALGTAAFSLGAGETSGTVDGRFSTVILNVVEVLPEQTTPYEKVKDQIVTDLAREQAEREILDLLDEIEDARAGGALLDEIGDRFDQPVQAPEAFDSSGKSMSGTDVTLPEAEGLVSGVFDSDVGIENDVVQIADRGFLWYDVTKVIPSRDRDLSDVKRDVVSAWKAEELSNQMDEKAADLLKQAETGAPLLAIAATKNLEVQSAADLTRSGQNSIIGRDALTAVFNGPVGTTATTQTADSTGRIVLKVTGSNVPTFDPEAPETAAIEGQISQQLRDSLIGQYITEQENLAGVEINSAGIAQVMGLHQNPM